MTRSRVVAFGALCVLAGPLTLVACGGDDGGNGGTDPVVVDAVSVGPATPSVEVGATVQLSATPLDDDGDALDRAVSWTSLNTGVATVSTSGLVTGVSAGSANIRATSEGVNGSVTVTVTPQPVASVDVAPDSSNLFVGGDVQLSATTMAADGDTLTGRTVTWASSNTAIAEVSNGGLVSATGAGAAVITASSEGVDGTAKVVVSVPSSVSIDSITPAILVEGGTATIHGSGFAATAASNTVTIDGDTATVTAATETVLQVTLPEPSACEPAHDAVFRVSVAGGVSPDFAHALQPETFLDLEVGEQTILSSAAGLCLQIAGGATAEGYVIGVQSTSGSGFSVTPTRLSAIAADGSGAQPLVAFQASASSRTAGTTPISPRSARLTRHHAAELRLREREQALVEELAAARAARSAGGIAASRMSVVPPDAEVGDTVALKVTNVDAANLCTTYFNVNAVVRVIGTSGVWLTDVENPAGGYSDAELQALSEMFDNQIYATDVDYLGPPTDIDGNGRIAILTTRRVNGSEGMLGFVWSGDLLPTGSCPASNEGEIYYGIAPDPTAVYGAEYTLEDAKLDAPALIAHEFAHILQNSNGNHSRAVWESEGQATLMEEVVGFAAQGRAPGNEYGIDVALNSPAADSIMWYYGHIVGLATYFGYSGSATEQIAGAPEQCSWLVRPPNGPCLNDSRLVYDVPRSLLRYISDQFGPAHPEGEQGVQRDLLESFESGYAAIEDVTGLPIETVLARWSASLYVDGRYENMSPALQTTSWDVFDIFDNISNPMAKLIPRARGFATFSDDFSVRGGSTAYFTVSGTGRPAVAIGVESQSGAALPAFMQVWVVRVQ